MAHDAHAPHTSRIHLTIDGDELTWVVRPKGLQELGLLLLVAGLGASVVGGLLAINILEHPGLHGYVRIVGAVSIATAGLSLMLTLVYLAVHDGWARATVRFDGRELTVEEFALYRSRTRQWSRDELKAITVGHHRSRHDLLAALKSAGMIRESSLRVQPASGEAQPVLGDLGLNGELTWLASVLGEHLNSPPGATGGFPRSEVLVEIDPHIAERGGHVAVSLPGPHGGGWGTVMVPVPPGVDDGARLPVRGLGPGGGDLHVRLRFSERDERTDSFDLARELAHAWEY